MKNIFILIITLFVFVCPVFATNYINGGGHNETYVTTDGRSFDITYSNGSNNNTQFGSEYYTLYDYANDNFLYGEQYHTNFVGSMFGNVSNNFLYGMQYETNIYSNNNYLFGGQAYTNIGTSGGFDNSNNNILIGNQAYTNIVDNSQNNILIGNQAYTNIVDNSQNNISIGTGSLDITNSRNNITIGSNQTILNSNNSIILGDGSGVTNENNVISVGNTATNLQRRIINVADPINQYDAVNLNYLTTNYYTKAQIATFLDTTTLTNSNYIDTQILSLSNSLNTNYYTKTQIDSMSNTTTTTSSVDTSYVNTKTQETLTSANTYTNTKAQETLQESENYTDQKTDQAINTSKNYTDQEVSKLKKNTNEGIAMVAAMSTPLNFDSGDNSMNIGVGNFENESAVALMIGKRVHNTGITYTMGVAKSSTKHALKASVGYSW